MDDLADLPQHACPLRWERDPRIDDGHGHDWHMVITQPRPGHREAMTVCRVCLAPRCGDTFDDDPCMERRHHTGLHLYESGRFEPLGGYLSREEDG